MSHLEVTFLAFYSVLFALIIFPLTYPNGKKFQIIEQRSTWLDWRIIMPCLIYALILGFRYDYAYDWDQYMNTFNYIQRGELYREDTEIGYLAINWLLGKIGCNYYSVFILEGFVWVFAYCYMFRHDRKMLLWILPIVFISTRFRCLNLSRQHFAMSIFFLAFAFLNEGKKKCFWITSIIACTIHTGTMLFVIPFYLITTYKEKIRFPKLIITLCIYVVIVLLTQFVISKFLEMSNILTIYIFKKYDATLLMSDTFQWEISTYRKIVSGLKDIIIILGIYQLMNKMPWNGRLYPILVLGLIGCLLRPIGESHEIFSRTFLYFVIFSHISFACWCYYMFKNLRKIPIYMIVVTIIFILQLIWSMYPQIIQEVTKQAIYIEYR